MPLINLSDAINSFIEIVLPYEHENHDIYPVMNCIEILAPSVNMTVTNETLSFACKQFCLNPQFCPPFISLSDQDRISPYIINTISSRQVMRILKKGHLGYH